MRKKSTQQTVAVIITAVIALSTVLALVATVFTSDDVTPAADVVARYEGIPRGITAEGLPRLGALDAPVIVQEISDFTCGHCANFHDVVFEDLLNGYIQENKAQMIFVPSVSYRTGSEVATRASFCALEQSKFWEMHDILFGFQTQGFNETNLMEAASLLEMDESAFRACLYSESTSARIESANALIAQRRTDGTFSGTPAVYINGEVLPNWNQTVDAVEAALNP